MTRGTERTASVRDKETLLPWRVDASETLLKERYLEVVRQRVTTGSGFSIPDYHLIRSPSWAAVVCLTANRDLILVRQYRHGHEAFSLELPAGVVEPGEDPVVTARRELLEETGYDAETIESFWQVRPEPARHRQMAYFSFARCSAQPRAQTLDASEEIRVELHPVAALDRIVSEMVHGIHIAALLLAERRGLFRE